MTPVNAALVIDDHPLVARGIADFLYTHCGFNSVTSVSNTAELWNHIHHADPLAMVVVDFWLPDGAALPLLQALRVQCPDTCLLVISADDNAAIEDRVRTAGADGFIQKQEATEVFVEAIAELSKGRTWFKGMAHRAGHSATPRELPVTAAEFGLTARQGQVLAMMLKGLPNKRIALTLSVSEQTVKEHVSGILNKLGANNRIEVITKLSGRRYE